MSEQKLLLSNRGNTSGKNAMSENTPEHLQQAYDAGFCIKTDIWVIGNNTVSGTDKPSHNVDLSMFEKDRVLIQARNAKALLYLLRGNFHCFWRDSDVFTMTNRNFVLSFSGMVFPKSILMFPEECLLLENSDYMGVCSDFIVGYTV